MTKDKSTPLGHTITHTDTAQGKGGGRLTEEQVTNPGGALADEHGTENARNRDYRNPSAPLPGTTAQEEADKKGTFGRDMLGNPD